MIRLFGVYVPKSLVLLGITEVIIFAVSFYLSVFVLHNYEMPENFISNDAVTGSASLFALVMFFSILSLGLYQPDSMVRASGFLVRLFLGFLIGAVAMGVLYFLLQDFFLTGRDLLGFSLMFSFLGILVTRMLFMRLTSESTLKRRVLVLGTGINADRIEDYYSSVNKAAFLVVGYVSLGDSVSLVDENRQIAKDQSLFAIANRFAVDEIVIAVDDRRKKLPTDELLQCKINGIKVLDLLTFFEKELSIINIELLYPSWMLFSAGFRQRLLGIYFKRLFDVSVSLVILIVASPFMLLVTIASLIESRGRDPILYSQVRVGKNGKPFRVQKFRSMRTDAESDGVARWATKNDARVTTLGKIIRKTRLDELPQLFNVLKGDMSLVGPRPERPEFVAQLSRDIPYYAERHWVKPGLTGWAQMLYPYAATEEDTKRKLEYDLYYVKNGGTMLDTIILLQTIEVVLLGKGAQ
ncbi:MAG: TIGR03013 family XrtA/PEP-CTERM system glycosyltransferase [Pseudomonadota bacterium]